MTLAEKLGVVAIVVSAIGLVVSVAIGLLTFMTWRVYKRMEWLYGALESHSMLMVRFAAREKGVPAVWWDPDVAEPPTAAQRSHGGPAELQTIYLYLPQRERSGWRTANRWQRFCRWLNAEI